jgi:hypothetical protein
MINPAFPNLVKLGCSTCHPLERAKQLTGSTSSPAPFTVAYLRRVSDCNAAESLLHERFAEVRVNDRREFFQTSVAQASFTMDKIAGFYPCEGPEEFTPTIGPTDVSVKDMKFPWAELFATFPDDEEGRELTKIESAACRELAEELARPGK